MGHPIIDPELDAKVRSMREAGATLNAIVRACGIGVNRARRICGLPLPPSQTAAAYRERHPDTRTKTQQPETNQPNMNPQETSSQKTITIPLTAGAHERLAAIAETAYLSPEAFAATLIASYLSYQPARIVLDPSDPEAEGGETEEDEDEETAPEEEEGFVFLEENFDWLKPEEEFVVLRDGTQTGVRCVSVWTFGPGGERMPSPDGRVHNAGDAIRCVAVDGGFEGERDFYPEEVVFED